MMRDTARSTDPADGGAPSEIGTVTAEHVAPDLRGLLWPVDALQPAPDNARAHADADVEAVAESLQEHRQQKPIVAKQHYRGLSNVVIAGHGTLQAARLLGWSHLAVTWFDGTDDEAREYAIRDNRTQELSAWDSGQLSALAADGVDLLGLWHDDAALADLLGADAPVPKFTPLTPAHRLDELADNTTCPACGHTWHQERR